jgi:hypothetical protein
MPDTAGLAGSLVSLTLDLGSFIRKGDLGMLLVPPSTSGCLRGWPIPSSRTSCSSGRATSR